MTNIDTTTILSEKEKKIIDQIIDLETTRKINKVKGSDKFDIATACYINNEFILISNYGITPKMAEELKKA